MYVSQVQPAPPALAGWIGNLIRPALAACRAEAVQLEIGPTGVWGGWAQSGSRAPHGRVRLSPRVVLSRPANLVLVYVHEISHVLRGVHAGHDPAFAALNMALLRRIDAAGVGAAERDWPALWSVDLYDLQDPPASRRGDPMDAWLPDSIGWALEVSAELAPTELSARDLAAEIVRQFDAWDGRRAEQASAAEAAIAAREEAAERELAKARAKIEAAELAKREALAALAATRERAAHISLIAAGLMVLLLVVAVMR